MIGPAKPTSVWWWPTPREGEIVSDHPPSDITSCIASVSFEDDLTPWQREVANWSFEIVMKGNVYPPCTECQEQKRRMHSAYRRRQLARRRRRR